MNIVLPLESISEWHGVNSNDYEHACKLDDNWITQINIHGKYSFILGSDPSDATVESFESGIMIIRWIFSDDEEDLIAFCRSGKGITTTERSIDFVNHTAEWAIINAADDGRNADKQLLLFLMPTENITIHTSYREGDTNAAIVHTFTKNDVNR